MTTVETRLSDEELQRIDLLVAQGVGDNRSDVLRLAVARLVVSIERHGVGRLIADSYRTRPQSPEEDAVALASAVAMAEAEPW